jgi:hypothetical protein
MLNPADIASAYPARTALAELALLDWWWKIFIADIHDVPNIINVWDETYSVGVWCESTFPPRFLAQASNQSIIALYLAKISSV